MKNNIFYLIVLCSIIFLGACQQQKEESNTYNIEDFGAVGDGKTLNTAAIQTALDKASENADELLIELRLTYNRTRQAAFTKEILEIVGGAEALEQG